MLYCNQKAQLLAAAIIAFGLCDSVSFAGTTYTSIGSGNWESNGTWSPSGVPGEGDRVIIQAGHAIGVNDDEFVDSFEIQANETTYGGIAITAGNSLTVDHDNGPAGDNILGGAIDLYGTLKFVDTDQTIEVGSGAAAINVLGGYDGELIIESERKLTSKINIYGLMVVKGSSNSDATFVNQGAVNGSLANQDGHITLESNLALEDSEGHYRWAADSFSGWDAGITFKHEATGLSGGFLLDNSLGDSVFVFEADVTTTGPLYCNSGTVTILGSVEFTYETYSGTEIVSASCVCSGGTPLCPQ